MSKPDVHRHQINAKALEIRFFGSLNGIPYGAVLDLKTGHVKWDDQIKYVEPHQANGTSLSTDDAGAGECPGCKNNIMKLVKGGFGWAKEVLGVGQVPAEVAVQRQRWCETCPSNCYDFGVCRDDWTDGRAPAEQGCGCILALKVTQASEECPHKHWLKHNG